MSVWTISIGGITRKWKKFELNRKVRMDSPPEFSAVIEYADDIDFLNVITIQRDGKTEWKGFIEELEVDWDENARYLSLGGRDVSWLLWRKYVENFNNPIPKTGGFFGTVSASELIQFLLRTPRSDLPVNAKAGETDDPTIQQYQFNKEGWGIDVSRFNGLDAKRTAYGDINSTILRRRNLYWSNSGSQFQTTTKVVDGVVSCGWDAYGTPPYLDTDDDISYIHSHIGINDMAEFTFQDFTVPENASAVNDCIIVIKWKPDGTYWTWINSNCEVQIWVDSLGGWTTVGNFGGKGSVFGEPWRIVEFDLSDIIKTVADVNAAKVRFIERSNSLSTNITYAYLSISFANDGNQTTDDWVSMTFDDETIMGIYVECRMHPDSFPRHYKITCNGAKEDFSDYEPEVDPNNHISLSSDDETITFDSYQDETAYFYKDYGAGSPLGDFDETFSFEINTSQPHPYAYIPWCLANDLEDYKTLINTPSHYFTAIEVNNSNGALTVRATLNDSGGLGHTASYDIDLNIRYFVKVTRVGTVLRYQIFDNSAMRTEDLILDEIFTSDETTFRYRYQAITYDGLEYALVYLNNMDHGSSGGEQVDNGDFETGDLTGWAWGGGTVTVVTTSPHSGTYCLELGSAYSDVIQDVGSYMNVLKDDVTSASLWHNAPSGSTFEVILYYTDLSFTEIPVNGISAWSELDLLPYWTSGKTLSHIEIWLNTAIMYIDDVSIFESAGWSRTGGTATHSTDTVNEIEGTGCQKIHGNANNEGYYFEEDISPATDQIKIDGYVRVPAPASEAVNVNLIVDGIGLGSGTYQWTRVNTSPYLHNDDDTDVVLSDAVTVGEFQDEWTFEDLDAKYGSFAPEISSDPTLNIKAKLYDGVGGHATTITVQVKVWVAHSSSWVTLGSFDCTDTVYATAVFNSIGLTLQTLTDWQAAKLKLNVSNIDGGGADKGGIRVTYAYLHCEGTGYMGTIRAMKVYNNAIASGPNPVADWVAGILFQLDPDSLTDIGLWRFVCDGFSGVGIWNTSMCTSEAVLTDTWYRLRLYAFKDSSAGYFKLYKITGITETLLCQVIGLDNHNYGSMDRYEFEIEYGTDNGNGQDAYLDWTTVQTIGPTHTTGYVYSGYGPDVVLINKIDNIYPDIIHSWTPRLINNLKISVTEADATHGWEISQIYLYKTDEIKYRVTLDGLSQPVEEKLTFGAGGYVPCEDTDIGKQVHTTTNIGALLSFDNTLREWRIASSTSVISGTGITITDGTGAGTLNANSETCYAGGPYIEAVSIDHDYTTAIGPLNIPKNRLFDILWDLCITITDDYVPYEWWIDYDSSNTFHISNRRGIDKSATISFTTGVNMGGVKYSKSSRDTYQRCQVIGTGEGNVQVNSSSFWEVDEDAMDEIHGFIEDIITQKQVVSPKIANRYAKVKLMLDASPKRKNAITCTINHDTYATFDYTNPTDVDTYNVGDDVTITDIFTSLNEALRIYNIKKNVDENGETVILTVQAPYVDIGNVWTQIWDELKQLGIVGVIVQDWAGEGTNSSSVNADKLSTLFTVTAKNEEVETEPDSSPKWWKTASPAHNANWSADNKNLSIWGGDSGGLGEMEVEARYEPQTSTTGSTILEAIDILMSQEPKFTGSFKIWEPTGAGFSFWNDNDYVEFGLFNRDTQTGFKFKVICHPSAQFTLYAIYMINGVIQGAPKPMCTLEHNHKYKVEILTDYKNVINTVTFNVYDEEVDDPASTQISSVFMKIGGTISVRPIYVHAYGDGTGGNLRCIMNFYGLKCERNVI